MEEIWKVVPGYEWYMVSNTGKVKSLNWRRWIPRKNPIIKSPAKDRCWYLHLGVSDGFNKKNFFVHRLVAMAFLEKGSHHEQVNHKNWIRDDNRVENLEWCTNSENQIHSFKVLWRKAISGKDHAHWGKFWENNKTAKSVNQLSLDWSIIKKWGSISDAAVSIWVNASGISSVLSGVQKTSWWYKWELA